jgi:proteasome-associated ATPase
MTMPGEIAMVRRVIGDMSEVEFQGSVHVVLNGRSIVEKGDRVVLDTSGSVILQNLGKDDERFRFTAETNVSWDDIGGLVEAKQQMIEVIELPHRNPELYEFYGKKPVKGVLLYGSPGCGKTMLGKATATALAKIYNGDGSSNGFLYVKGPEILDRFVGVAEATIRQLFERARKHKAEFGYPAVIFIDEADAILGKRGTGISSDIERTIVPMFLTEMDGLEDSGAVVILATNRPDVLDPAVVRDGRIDRKIKITRPDRSGAVDIFELNLNGMPLNNGYSVKELAETGADQLFSKERVLYHVRLKGDNRMDLTLGQICNGGMIAGIVDQATSTAMHRDIETGEPQGLRKEDIIGAVDAVFCQNLGLNHTDELTDFTHDFREDVVGIRRLSQTTA